MREENHRRRLGRGLSALLEEANDSIGSFAQRQERIPLDKLRPNPHNPRKFFDKEKIDELTASIREKGVIQPILVRTTNDDRYQIIAGERRWRASQAAGLADVPVVVIDVDDKTAFELSIIENVQRANLNPIDEAEGYRRLISQFNYTQQDLAHVIGKSRSHIANMLRLSQLPKKIKEKVQNGRLSAGHARILLSVSDPEEVANQIIQKNLSVRDVEALAQKEARSTKAPKIQKEKTDDSVFNELEERLSEALGLIVAIKTVGAEKQITLSCKNPEEFQRVCRKLLTSAG